MPALHYVAEGRCQIDVPGIAEPMELGPGDVLFMRRGADRWVHDGSGAPPTSLRDLITIGRDHDAVVFEHGGDGARASVLGGGIALSGPGVPVLLDALPRHFVLRVADTRAMPLLQRQLECLAAEAQCPGPGSRLVIARITEVLFLLVLRAYSEQARLGGWLGAARHPQIGLALGAMHRRPEHGWTVQGLARCSGMSRSSFSAKFQRLLGEPPLRYLTQVRMDHAAELLAQGQLDMASIAQRVGYGSEPSFATAFKRWSGRSPGSFRRARRAAQDAAYPRQGPG